MGLRVLCGGDTNGVGQSELLGLSLDQQAIDDDYPFMVQYLHSQAAIYMHFSCTRTAHSRIYVQFS
jgi:hypothetical protein